MFFSENRRIFCLTAYYQLLMINKLLKNRLQWVFATGRAKPVFGLEKTQNTAEDLAKTFFRSGRHHVGLRSSVFRAGLLFVYSALAQFPVSAQEGEEFSVSLEFRPRTELRNGYRQLRTDTTGIAFYTSQRSRLYLTYKRPGFIFHTSIQDVRIWGEDDPRSTAGTLQVFETYVEPSITERLSVRIGRQKIMYDNQRLFAQNNWRQNAGSHDAVRFVYKAPRLDAELVGAFNQSEEKVSGTGFLPSFSNYKVLGVSYLKYKATDFTTFTALNAVDGFQDKDRETVTHFRYTNGGRVEYEKSGLYLTLSGYYQHGHTPSGKKVRAFYFQSEAKYRVNGHITARIGAEIFSGDNGLKASNISHSFDALYGVNHRFLGSLDYFIRFPADYNNAGLVAPYVFAFYDFNEKWTLRMDQHLFFMENNLVVDDRTIDKYLGYENDLLLTYRPNDFTVIDLGFSWMLAEKSMEAVRGGGNSDKIPYWSYLMITFTPELFRWERDGSL